MTPPISAGKINRCRSRKYLRIIRIISSTQVAVIAFLSDCSFILQTARYGVVLKSKLIGGNLGHAKLAFRSFSELFRSAKRGYATVSCPSVCPSVYLYCRYIVVVIRSVASKEITRVNRLESSLPGTEIQDHSKNKCKKIKTSYES